nr:hypothetical protein [Tanacetum cinerariifolium]
TKRKLDLTTGINFLGDDILFSTIKVVSRHQNTQQYGAILPIKLTTEDIRNTKAYKEYYACATGEATPKPKASARRKRKISWNSSDNEDVDAQDKDRDDDEGKKNDESDDDDDNNDEEEIAKINEPKDTESGMVYLMTIQSLELEKPLKLDLGFVRFKTMATMIEQQVALDEALVPSAQRSSFFKAFLVTAYVPEIYMQEFWATAYVHQHSIRFKMDARKNIVDLEAFREMLHISPRVPGQSFAELPFKEEIFEFLRFLGYSAQIKTLTDVNVNKLYYPWRSFAVVINKCMTGKSSGFDSLRLSQAQILWGLYHKRNVDYAFLIWEDFVYQVEHKNQKKSNEMYYPRFTKVIIHHFMTRKPSIPRRNKVNWHYVRDDILFSTIKVVSRHQNTQQYGAILPIELTIEDIRNTKAYKEYYACATGEAAPKPKASARRKKGASASSTTPPTLIAIPTPITTVMAAPRLIAAAKGKQPARATSLTDPSKIERTEVEQLKIVLRRSRHETHISQHGGSSIDEGTGSKPWVSDVPSDDLEEEISWNTSDDEDVDDQTKGRDDNEGEKTDKSDDDDEEEISKIDEQEATESGEGDDEETESDGESEEEETRENEEESFDPIPRTPKESEDDGNDEEDQGLRISEEERMQEEEEADELYRDVDINQGRGLQVSQDIDDSHVTLTPIHSDGQESSLTSSFVTSLLNPIIDPAMESIFTTGSSSVTPIPSPKSTMTPSIITTTTTASQPPIPPTPIPNRLQDSLKRENDEFLRTIDDNMKKIIKEQRRREDDDDQEGPSVVSDRGSKRRREGGEHASASTLSEPATTSAGRSTIGTQSRQMSGSESVLQRNLCSLLVRWMNPHIRCLKQEPLNYDKHALWGVSHWGRKRQQFYGFAVNQEFALDVYSKRRIIAVTDLKIVEWHNYKHLDCISVRRDDDKIYKFKECDFKRLRLQDIKDMLLLLVQWKLSNLTVEERFAFNVSLRMFTRSIVIQRRVKDL